jgi:hypothetical protein
MRSCEAYFRIPLPPCRRRGIQTARESLLGLGTLRLLPFLHFGRRP